MATRDTHVPPPVRGGNNHARRRSSPARVVYQWKSCNRAWKSARSMGHLQPIIKKSTPR
ncbi:hypothetical protein PVK06_043065 [Gossypium arboreum]|uniref:Uncharacterized protein n=1 Tax=Gossypium arboreum TaxID=29729 RepID=A0ABR0MMX2_GOSAR|nr:hypothetical protein PVK06_043065 [Gossypium arboreum]